MKKIIIISEYYAPENVIGAVRMSKITKYLNSNYEYHILVIAKEFNVTSLDEILEKDIQGKATVKRIPESEIVKKIQTYLSSKNSSIQNIDTNKNKLINKVNSKIKNAITFTISFVIAPILFKRKAMKYLKEIDINEYSTMISSFGPLSSHLIAKQIKKKNPNIQWIADFRDPVLNIFTPIGFRNYSKNLARRITKNADIIVAVSSGYMEALSINEDKKKCIITNGYDKDDIIGIKSGFGKKNKLILSYTGALYAGKRDFSVLFQVISNLCDERKIDKDNIEIQYAGSSGNELIKQASKYGLESLVLNNGYISREKSLELQINSDALLLATWNTTKGLGNIPGKFLEYMMMNKPIICVTIGEILESEVKGIINKGKLGYCYEEASEEEGYQEFKKYIYELYENKVIEKKRIPFSPIKEVVESYNYENKSKQFEELF